MCQRTSTIIVYSYQSVTLDRYKSTYNSKQPAGLYRFKSLHVGGGSFHVPLLQVSIGFPMTVAPLKHTNNAVSPSTNTLPFVGCGNTGHTPVYQVISCIKHLMKYVASTFTGDKPSYTTIHNVVGSCQNLVYPNYTVNFKIFVWMYALTHACVCMCIHICMVE